ncbi:unnamed protein product [Schistocephalus solidus]|uniref:Uncharacterized protein n=1 Tax=Schistocephalus solidus TaxID=70667 RepID=A0A183T090_SCHSO|nr:unnamed protein product [Schistocephalus solidus]
MVNVPVDALNWYTTVTCGFSAATSQATIPTGGLNQDKQRNKYLFAAACDNFGPRISTEKMVVIHQPPPNTIYTTAHINEIGTQLKSVDTCTYLGSNLSRSTKVGDFGRLCNFGLRINMENWTRYHGKKRLESFTKSGAVADKETMSEKLLRMRMVKPVAAMRRIDTYSQVVAHAMGSGHTFKFDDTEILARADNRVSRELLES